MTDSRKRILAGIACLLFAIYLAWLGVAYNRLPSALFNAPQWLFFLLSLLLGAATGLAFLGQDHHLSSLIAAVIWVLFAIIGAWAALISPLDNLSGGITFFSPTVNVVLARILFGLGAILNLGAGVYAVWRFINK